MTLHLAPGLDLPDHFATEGVVAVGMRGSGKSNTLARWTEVLYDAKIPFVVVDPKGDWGGIRSSADGKKPGLSVPVFGGLAGDAPLGEKQGTEIAALLVDHNLSAVLDVSGLTHGARARFLIDFCHELMARHRREPHVRCVIFEEAHRYIPQQVKGPTAALKEAAASILLEGRAFGLGCWAATQRPARLHKDVLEEVGTVFLHRIGAAATNDLRTISGWVKHEDLSDEIIPSLTKLRPGEAWVLSPSDFDIAIRVQVDRRTTFDSAATPVVGAGSRPTLTMADIDMDAIRSALAESIEKAKENDPAELHRRIRALEHDLANVPAPEPIEVKVEVPVEVPVVPDEIRAAWKALAAAFDEQTRRIEAAIAQLRVAQDRPGGGRPQDPPPAPKRTNAAPAAARATPTRASTPPLDTDLAGQLGKGELRVLGVLSEYPEGRSMGQVAFLAGYSQRASTCGNVVSRLRKLGLVEKTQPVRLTPEGARIAPAPDKITGDALWDKWMNHKRVGEGERKVLRALRAAWPEALTHEDLCVRTDYSPDASTCGNVVSRLRKLGLVEKTSRRLQAEFADALGL